MNDYLVSSVLRSMAKLIIRIVEDSGELMKASLKYAVNRSVSTRRVSKLLD